MPSRNVSLEVSVYERLKAAKRPGESFTQVIDRVLAGPRPTLRVLAGALGPDQGEEVKQAILEMRGLEANLEQASMDRLFEKRRAHTRLKGAH